MLEIIEPEVSTWSRSGDLLAKWGEIDVLCAKPCRASQRGLVSGKVGNEAFHTEGRGEDAAPENNGKKATETTENGLLRVEASKRIILKNPVR